MDAGQVMGAHGYRVSVNHIGAVVAGVARRVRDQRMLPGTPALAVTIPRSLLLPSRHAILTRSEDAHACALTQPVQRARGSKPARPPIAATDPSARHSNNVDSPGPLTRDKREGGLIDSGRQQAGVRHGALPMNRLIPDHREPGMRTDPGQSHCPSGNISLNRGHFYTLACLQGLDQDVFERRWHQHRPGDRGRSKTAFPRGCADRSHHKPDMADLSAADISHVES